MIKNIQTVPTKINQEYELTGEYRIPQRHLNDMWANSKSDGFTVFDFRRRSLPNKEVNEGKRWILRKKELPPKPSQIWLDKHSVELTGECRIPKNGEQVVSWNGASDSEASSVLIWQERYSEWLSPSGPGSVRWILRKQEEPKEEKFLVMILSRNGKPEYYRAPGEGLTDRREDALKYSWADALSYLGRYKEKSLFITYA